MLRYFISSCALLSMWCFSGCIPSEDRNAHSVLRPIRVNYDTLIAWPIDSSFHQTTLNFISRDNDSVLYLYHQKYNYLSVFNLATRSLIEHTKLDDELLSLPSAPWAFIVKSDSILLFTENKLIWLNSNGKINRKIDINENESYYIWVLDQSHVPTSDLLIKEQVVVPLVPNISKGTKNPNYYKKAISGILNLKTFHIDTFPIHYPGDYIESYQGMTYGIQHACRGSAHLYGFQNSDSVIIYTPATNHITTVFMGAQERGNRQSIPWKDIDQTKSFELMDFFIMNSIYAGIGYEPNSKLYYREYYEAIPLQDSLGNFHTFKDKKRQLLFYDTLFNYVGEVENKIDRPEVSNHRGLYQLHSTKDHLYIVQLRFHVEEN